MILRCKYCGKLYDGVGLSGVTCGRYECKMQYKKEYDNMLKAKQKIRKAKHKKDQLARDAKAAKKLGVSYGVYMGLYKNKEVYV